MIEAGVRDRLISFERATTTTDDYGDEVETWAEQATAWAKVLFGTGQERREAAQESASQVASFLVNWTPTLAQIGTTDRIQFDSAAWDITSVAPVGRHDELHITAVRSA